MTALSPSPEWQDIASPSVYEQAVDQMRDHAQAVITGGAGEAIFTTEHQPVYTAGTSARKSELLADKGFEIVLPRGPDLSWARPADFMAGSDLNKRKRDIRAYIHALEGWMADMLANFGVEAVRREGLPGLWVARKDIICPTGWTRLWP